MNVWNISLHGRGELEKAFRQAKINARDPVACDRLAQWLRPRIEKSMKPSRMTEDALVRWVCNFEAVQSGAFDDWHDDVVLALAKRNRGGKVTSKPAFCPFCGGGLELRFAGKVCIGGRCLSTGTRLPTGNTAEYFGRQLEAPGQSGSNFSSLSSQWFCAGCGKKLRSRASRSDRGWFSVTPACPCGRFVNENVLCDLPDSMRSRHERRSPVPEKPLRPDPSTLNLPELARKGDIETLRTIADGDPASDNDALAYKWLCVAADFGHRKALAAADDLLEVSSLRHDDGGELVAVVHQELAAAYTKGKDGLPRDAAKARRHAEAAR